MRIQKKNYKRINLKQYANEEVVRWNNFVVPKTQYLEFKVGEGETNYKVYIRSKPPKIVDQSVGLLVEIDGHPAALWLSTWPLIERIRGYITESKLKNLPQELRAELLEAALDPLLSAITNQLKIPIKVLNFLKITPDHVNDYSVFFQIAENNVRDIDVVLVMNEKIKPVIEALLSRWPSYYYPSWKNHVTPIWLEAGAMDLSLSELKGVELGDVLLLSTSDMIKTQEVVLRLVSGERLRGRIEDNKITVMSGVIEMSEESRDDEVVGVEDLPVKLTFDIGEMVLPFHEIESLTSGYIIDLKEPFAQIVKIRSQNRVLGTGELVDINGKVGVRIVSLFGINTNG